MEREQEENIHQESRTTNDDELRVGRENGEKKLKKSFFISQQKRRKILWETRKTSWGSGAMSTTAIRSNNIIFSRAFDLNFLLAFFFGKIYEKNNIQGNKVESLQRRQRREKFYHIWEIWKCQKCVASACHCFVLRMMDRWRLGNIM